MTIFKLGAAALAALALLAASEAQARPSQAQIGADTRISRNDPTLSVDTLSTLSDTQVLNFFSGTQTVQASTSLLWPLPADVSLVQGQFNAVAQASVNMSTVELHALAAAGGTRIAREDAANATASLNFTVLSRASTSFTFPFAATFSLDGASEINPLPGETRAVAFGVMRVTAEGLSSGRLGDPIVTAFEQQVSRSTDPRGTTASNVLQVQAVWETNRGFNIDIVMKAFAQFNGVADFSHTGRLVGMEAPLGVDLEIAGVQLVRDGTHYTVLGQTSAVPEPAAWALMLGGLVALALTQEGARAQRLGARP